MWHAPIVIERDLLALRVEATCRRLRTGRRTEVDTAAYEDAMSAVVAELAEGMRRQREVATEVPAPLPDVSNIRKAWSELTVEHQLDSVVFSWRSIHLCQQEGGWWCL